MYLNFGVTSIGAVYIAKFVNIVMYM